MHQAGLNTHDNKYHFPRQPDNPVLALQMPHLFPNNQYLRAASEGVLITVRLNKQDPNPFQPDQPPPTQHPRFEPVRVIDILVSLLYLPTEPRQPHPSPESYFQP